MSDSKDPAIEETLELLVTASRILYQHEVLDGFGHISARNPTDPSTFFSSVVCAALLTSADFVEYKVSDGQPTNPDFRISPSSEHFIHAAIFARFPDVNSVVHSHARPVLPFTVGGQKLRPVIHTAGFLSWEVPVWDAAHCYHGSDNQHLLVNSYSLGRSLANAAWQESEPGFHSVVLQRGHGFVVLGKTVQNAVYNAYYTLENAVVLSQAVQIGGEDAIRYINKAEAEAGLPMNEAYPGKLWPLWVKEVEVNPMFTRLRQPT